MGITKVACVYEQENVLNLTAVEQLEEKGGGIVLCALA